MPSRLKARQLALALCHHLELGFTPKHEADGTPYYEFEGEGTLAKLLESLVPISDETPNGVRERRDTGIRNR